MNFIKSFYISIKGFWILGGISLVFTFGLLYPFLIGLGKLLLILFLLVLMIEIILLYQRKSILLITRLTPKALSNGDENIIKLKVKNFLKLSLKLKIREDLPNQLQGFTWQLNHIQKGRSTHTLSYSIFPTQRGIYKWYNSYALVSIPDLGLVTRKLLFDQYHEVACLPSYKQYGDLRISALVSQQKEMDAMHIRKLGQSMEFEQIRNYVIGDDFRHINWKSSAKQGKLMLNQYQAERSQQIYCVLDCGRTMKTLHNGLSLHDYAINTSIGLSKVILQANDKLGLINYYTNRCDLLKSNSSPIQFRKVNEMLFKAQAEETDASMEFLYKFTRKQLKQRSLLMIFTHFDNIESIKRNIPYLKAISRFHLVLIVLFENAELQAFADSKISKLRDIYSTTLAREQVHQQQVLARELRNYGILSLITHPEKLTLSIINQYLEIKRKQML